MDSDEVLAGFFIAVICLVVGGAIGSGCQKTAMEKQAVAHGAAEYRVGAYESTEFVWKER